MIDPSINLEVTIKDYTDMHCDVRNEDLEVRTHQNSRIVNNN